MRPIADDITDLALIAHSLLNVMVTARNGTDRAAWARTIHDRSARCEAPFVAVCGHSLFAENRAVGARDVDDWFKRARGGTLFIDLVWGLNPHAQAQFLLRLTEQSRQPREATTLHRDRHVRIIAASNRSLRADLAVGAFSEALFYRLNVIHIDQMCQNEPGEGPRESIMIDASS